MTSAPLPDAVARAIGRRCDEALEALALAEALVAQRLGLGHIDGHPDGDGDHRSNGDA